MIPGGEKTKASERDKAQKKRRKNTYASHLGGAVKGSDDTDGHEGTESGQDELVTATSEVDWDVGGLLYNHVYPIANFQRFVCERVRGI